MYKSLYRGIYFCNLLCNRCLMKRIRYQFSILMVCLLLAAVCFLIKNHTLSEKYSAIEVASGTNGNYIKWVDFNVSYEALCAAYDLDVQSYDSPVHLNWIELLAYAGAKGGGSFSGSAAGAFVDGEKCD